MGGFTRVETSPFVIGGCTLLLQDIKENKLSWINSIKLSLYYH